MARLPSPAPLPLPDDLSPRLDAHVAVTPWPQKTTREYVWHAVQEALALVEPTTKRNKAPCQRGQHLEAVVAACIARQPEAFEMRSLELECVRQQQHAVWVQTGEEADQLTAGDFDSFGVEVVARVLWEWQERQPESVRILRRRDRAFAIVHGGASRAEVLKQASESVRRFGYANAAVGPLAAAVLVLAIAERCTLALFPESVGVCVCAGLLLASALTGLCGSCRLISDLRIDEDGVHS
jgi:hypothetical protein